jgi:hypothetical protein
MKRIFTHACLIVGLLTAMMQLSCKKNFLDLRPPTSLPVEDALKTEADLMVALRGAYAGLRTIDLWGRTIPVVGDVMADNAYISIQNSNRYLAYHKYEVNRSDGNVLGLWTNAYHVILRCNNIINANPGTSTNVNQYKGEAFAVRALLYFTLLNFFSKPYSEDPDSPGVPVVKEFNQNLLPPRNTVAEVYNLVLSDLAQAYTLMTQFTNSSQFSKFAARALEAKVQLYKGDVANAKIAALDVINNGGFVAVNATNYKSYWDNEIVRTDRVETLFEVSSDAVGNNGFEALGYIYSQQGYGDLLCSSDLFALYSGTDVRRTILATGVRGGSASVFINKYPDIGGDRSDTKVLRLSDTYLIAAEACLPGNETEARSYLNYIATRRDASFTGYTSTGNVLFDDIIRERRKELAFEGDRFHDLNRLKRIIQRSTNYPLAARIINYPDYRRVLPIPQAEMDANPNIQQNPGY